MKINDIYRYTNTNQAVIQTICTSNKHLKYMSVLFLPSVKQRVTVSKASVKIPVQCREMCRKFGK